MKIAFILFDGVTMLDFIGIYDPISRLHKFLPDLKISTCAYTEEIQDSFGLTMKVDVIQPDLSNFDVIIVPGGYGTRKLQKNNAFLTWIRTAEQVPLKVSICTGSLILGAAVFLVGKKATTHFDEYESLERYCEEVMRQRIVEDEGVITAGAVSSSLDLGLYLCEKWAGKEATKWIRKRMDYHG
ncbi:MAG: DJ-1/PfpI family protein [Bacteroidia bacterium]|nr:DJ-1/PfpI family protein [Bacteroidia bacterium]